MYLMAFFNRTEWLSLSTVLVLGIACADSENVTQPRMRGVDANATGQGSDAGAQDAGSTSQDAAIPSQDSGASSFDASSSADAGAGPQADAGSIPMRSVIVPGSHAVIAGTRIDLGETYSSVRTKLGAGTQPTVMGNRSKQYDLGTEGELTIWFANTGLNADPGTNIDDKDEVLWIAVTSSFTGQTPDGLGMGSTRQAVEAVYGMSPRTTQTTMPAPGTIATYYRRGLLVGYDNSEMIRTLTICREYLVEPDGQLDLARGVLTIGNTVLQASGSLIGGTSESTVRRTLGDPADAEGNRQGLEILSYAFLGYEIFLNRLGGLMFVTVHTPFYGKSNGVGELGMTKADFESHLAAEDFGIGQVSSTSNSVYCYQHRQTDKYVGVSYSGTPESVSSITLAMPSSACN